MTTAVLFVVVFWADPTGLLWGTPFVGACVAGVIAARAKPEQVAARRLLAFGVLATMMIGGSVGLSEAFDAHGQRWWLGLANVALQLVCLAMGAAMIALVAAYPDGGYHRRHERPLVATVAGLAVAVPILLLLTWPTLQPAWVFGWDEVPGRFPEIESPVHVGLLSALGPPLRAYHDAAGVLAPLVAVLVVAARYHRLRERERLQVRWLMYGALLLLLAPLAEALRQLGVLSDPTADLIVIAGLLALPAALATGLVRPDLFAVDRAFRRSLVYAPVWIAIGGVFLGAAAALGLAASSAGVQIAIVVTIAATALFDPVRRHLAQRAASWAYGESVSGEELVRRLGATLEHTLDLEQLVREVASIAREGLGAQWVSVRVYGIEVAIDGESPPPGETPVLSAPLVHAGERLGEIECGARVRGRPHRSDPELFATLARQAALAIHNAQLAAELSGRLDEIGRQADELAASRSRIVAADESARRRIERDIHDGAQQELVALMARIGLARSQLGRDPSGLDLMLTDLQSEVGQVLENLRELASGIHPSVLSDHGLVEAIEIRSRRLPIAVTIECAPPLRDMRFGDDVEGAAFFFVSEGLANTLKHSGAQRARVRIACSAGELEIGVADDGAGFDVQAAAIGGLRGIADRVEALGGSVAVDSSPGHGATLTARLPISDPAIAVVRR